MMIKRMRRAICWLLTGHVYSTRLVRLSDGTPYTVRICQRCGAIYGEDA